MEDLQVNISDRICQEIEDKFRVLNEYAFDREQNGDKEGLVQIRVHQLALSKVLVNVHERSKFVLVNAHTNLGESYLNIKYYEQALEHLTNALKINGTLFSSLEETKQFHATILTLLGRCYLEAGQLQDAESLLNKALKMNHVALGDQHVSNANIHNVLQQVYVKQKKYAQAIDCLQTCWELYEAQFGLKHESVAGIYYEMAKVYKKQKDLDKAIDSCKRSLQTYLDLDQNTEQAAKICVTLSQYFQEQQNFQEAINALRQAEQINEFHFGLVHKSTLKVKRSTCMLLLKMGQYEEALEECLEIEELDKQLHGSNSLQFAKGLKVTGTILMILNRYKEAKEYYSQAYKIFKNLGNQKQAKDMKNKIKAVEQQANNTSSGEDQFKKEFITKQKQQQDEDIKSANSYESSDQDQDQDQEQEQENNRNKEDEEENQFNNIPEKEWGGNNSF